MGRERSGRGALIEILRSSRFRIAISCVSGFLAYGAWAIWINGGFSDPAAWRAGWVQGLYSAFITAVLSGLMEWLLARLQWGRRVLAVLLPSLLLFGTSTTLHLLSGTPKVLATIAPSYLMSVVTIVAYVVLVERMET